MDIDKAIRELAGGGVVLSGQRRIWHRCEKCRQVFAAVMTRSTKRVTSFRKCPICGSLERVVAEPVE